MRHRGPYRRFRQGPRQEQQHAQQQHRRSDAERIFQDKTPLTPFEWIRFENGSKEPAMRVVDLLSPVGKGQRGLIVSPPKVGKTTILKQFCLAAAATDPNLKVYCMLVDERPEEVTDFRRSVKAEIFASSNDRPFEEHIRMGQTVYQKALTEAGSGKDVLIVLDSLTRLARVHNTASKGDRTMTGGLDSRAMEWPRKFFGAARKLEEGGSLTILATILVDTGSRMDEVIFQEFKGTGNMELVLFRPAAEARLFPAIHVKNTGTRREELLLPEPVLQGVYKLRRSLSSMGDLEATKTMIELIRKYPTNEGLLAAVQGGM
ncbi:MAG TPA: transcription termination factor Rho [Elusimicrobia bacterium]|nr:transcription termination factor Rho [Elusimicrobiota bacterium]